MARPRGGYVLADGTKVPGVTTITGRFKDSGGLIHWAWRQGSEGKDFREERDKAADAGTLAHAMIEARIRGADPTEPCEGQLGELVLLASQGFEAYERWARQSSVEILHAEESLVSEKHRFGGTYDGFGSVSGRKALIDFKTGGIYPEHLAQCGGYEILIEENHGVSVEEIHILQLGKEDASFHHHSYRAFPESRESFLTMRRLYDLDKFLKGKL